MSRHILVAGALGVLSLHGQGVNGDLFQIQRDLAQTLEGNFSGGRVLDAGFGNRVVTGKPFSATEERHSLQVLGDGTRIENNETNRLYRDPEGRTRVEAMNGTITIYDPVAKLRVDLDPATKTARKSGVGNFYFYGANGTPSNYAFATPYGSSVVTGQTAQNNAALKGVMAETTENLSSQSINGVTAQGIRTTMTIPKGQIGNNKDIKVLTERWSSTDLQMLVKSINSDPRFGDTTYQLNKVVQTAPDPALFQIPADYTVTEQPLRGVAPAAIGRGRGGVPANLPVPALVPTPAK
jgi:hypothetical protein